MMASQMRACVALSCSSHVSVGVRRCSSLASSSKTFNCEGQRQWGPNSFDLQTSPKSRIRRFHASSATSNSGPKQQSGGESPRRLMSTLWSKAPEPLRKFPWGEAFSVFVGRVLDIVWVTGKWLAIPMLLVSALSELSYTLVQKQPLMIPIGMVGGFAFAGIMKETIVEFAPDIQKGERPWHLLAIGMVFVLIKAAGPYLPLWGRVILPQFANGGLIQVLHDWRRRQATSTQQ